VSKKSATSNNNSWTDVDLEIEIDMAVIVSRDLMGIEILPRIKGWD